RFGGIGLGLYIVRQLARAQGGEVIASRRPGGGTAMTLTLPRASASSPGAAESAPDEPVADEVKADAADVAGAGGGPAGGADIAVPDEVSADAADGAAGSDGTAGTNGAGGIGRGRPRSALPWSSLAKPMLPHPRKPLDDRGTGGPVSS